MVHRLRAEVLSPAALPIMHHYLIYKVRASILKTYDVTLAASGQPKVLVLSSSPLQGSDGTDQVTQGSWTSRALAIASLATNNFVLRYNGNVLVAGDIISSYNPSLLSIEPSANTPGGIMSTSFQYATIDIASQQDQTPATYAINWSFALPVTLEDF